MRKSEISEDLRRFIFESIDSVEQLEVLLFLRLHRDKRWSGDDVSSQLRSSPLSVSGRLTTLCQMGFLTIEENGLFKFSPTSHELEGLAEQLAEAYKVRPHKILELIFSPLKRARHFAEAFVVNKPNKKDSENG